MAAAVTAVVVATRDSDDEPAVSNNAGRQHRTEAWSAEAEEAYKPLGEAALRLPLSVREWLDGTRSAEQVRIDIDQALTATVEVRERVAALRPFPLDGRVNPLYRSSAELYVAHVEIYREAVAAATPDARTQLDVLARRTRLLADRVFDRGHALVEPYAPAPRSPDVEVNLPEEVPNWTAEGLALAPPLTASTAPPPSAPPLREATRPVQPRDAWLEAVRRVGTPSDPDQIEAAAETLRGVPDPATDGGREESARVRLGLLVRAEAGRLVHAAGVFNVASLRDVGARVLAAAEPLR